MYGSTQQRAGGPWQLCLAPAPGAEPSAAKSVTSAAGGTLVSPNASLDGSSDEVTYSQQVLLTTPQGLVSLTVKPCTKSAQFKHRFFPFPLAFPPAAVQPALLHTCCTSFSLRQCSVLLARPELGGTERGQGQKKSQTSNFVQSLLKLASFSCPTGTCYVNVS